MPDSKLSQQVIRQLEAQGEQSAGELANGLGASRPTLNRALAALVESGQLLITGAGRSTRYLLAGNTPATGRAFAYGAAAQERLITLQAPLGAREPVGYQREFVERYLPNHSSLLPAKLAQSLFEQGRARGQQPAGTYARTVLQELLIDLSWHSSRLEGNRKSLLDTRALFARGRSPGDDVDAIMLLNHKDAIEFIVDAVPEYGLRVPVLRNIQAALMSDLLRDPAAIGGIRHTVVNISDSAYVPLQAPGLLEEVLEEVVAKAKAIKNPVEAAFFLWVNIAYLQPFEDGNKRTSRLSANLPLLLQNCAPLSFIDVQNSDYAMAMLAVYEYCDVSLAVELFEWTYLRSIKKYEVLVQAMGVPDPLRARYREALRGAVSDVVLARLPLGDLQRYGVEPKDLAAFGQLLSQELSMLQPFNCSRYRLGIRIVEAWIADGRPGA
ncbi:Fic family protein [Pseudomonas sp. NPDC007930]|uniref:Fic family protein n=1 Tax=Pseudomonas sp. NPDC007930 TaxID=3364417 RepID=UPI0036ED7CD3